MGGYPRPGICAGLAQLATQTARSPAPTTLSYFLTRFIACIAEQHIPAYEVRQPRAPYFYSPLSVRTGQEEHAGSMQSGREVTERYGLRCAALYMRSQVVLQKAAMKGWTGSEGVSIGFGFPRLTGRPRWLFMAFGKVLSRKEDGATF